MSVTANDRFKSTAGDGTTVDFDIDFPFASTAEVIVATVTAGVKTVLSVGYTITPTAKTYPSDATYPGGTITFTAAPAVGTTVQRYGETASTQAVTIPSDATLFSSGVQNIVDKLTRLYQEAKRELGFTVQVTPGTAQINLPPIADGPGYMYTDGTNPYELVNEVTAGSLVISGDSANRIPYWTAASTLASEAPFAYDPATNTQTVDNITVATNITGTALTASRAVVTNGSKVLASSATTATELGYVNGVTSAIQTQLDAKQASGDYPTVLARTAGYVTVGGTVTETALISFTVPAGVMSTNKSVRVRLFGNWSHDGTNTITFRLKYDDTTVASMSSVSIVTGATNDTFIIDAELGNNNSASAQVGHITATYEDDTGTALQTKSTYGTAAENSANALTLAVTVEWGTGDASDTISLMGQAVLY